MWSPSNPQPTERSLASTPSGRFASVATTARRTAIVARTFTMVLQIDSDLTRKGTMNVGRVKRLRRIGFFALATPRIAEWPLVRSNRTPPRPLKCNQRDARRPHLYRLQQHISTSGPLLYAGAAPIDSRSRPSAVISIRLSLIVALGSVS